MNITVTAKICIRLLFLSLGLFSTDSFSQTLTLDQCYTLARQNYPLIIQKELIGQSKDFTIANAHTGNLPQLAIYGQATYQSDITKLSIDVPGFPKVQPLSKDQYKVYAEVNQNLYDGGAIKKTSTLHEASAQVETQRVEVELYKINERINQIYFGILLLDQQLAQLNLLKKDIETSAAKVKALIENGTAFRTNADILDAELLKTAQREIEIKSSKSAFLSMLSLFIRQELSPNSILEIPSEKNFSASEEIARPELTLFNYQKLSANSQYAITTTRNMPRAGLFVQGGYGKPGLNMLQNEFTPYAIGGLRLSWNLTGFYNGNREKQLLEVSTKMIDAQQELFLFNTRLLLRQNSAEVNKLLELIKIDEQLIMLRLRIKETAKAQLDNGVITANDFVRELNAEDQTRQNLALHRILLMQTIYNFYVIAGR